MHAGLYRGVLIMGVTKGDTRNLDNSLYSLR